MFMDIHDTVCEIYGKRQTLMGIYDFIEVHTKAADNSFIAQQMCIFEIN